MPLTTISFDTLRERNSRDLEKSGFAPDASASHLEALTAQQHARIGTLLQKRADIESLASTQNQREAYGIESWHATFTRLRDLRPEDGSDPEALRMRVWAAVPNSRFKRFQELFCHPHQFIVPQHATDTAGAVRFPGTDFNTLSLAPCLVSPDRIGDEFARNLRLCEFAETDRPEDRLRKKHDAIPRLKKIWESARPLQEGHHRLLVVQPTSPELDARYPHAEGPHPDAVGSILYTREDENGNGTDATYAKRCVQCFSSVYDAERKTLHEEHAYDKEFDALVTLETKLESHKALLDREWRKPERRDALRETSAALLTACIEALRACRNKYKVEANDFATQAVTLRDTLGRENVSVTMSKMVAIINRFKRRYAEAKPKGGYNTQDRMTLRQHIRQHEHILGTVRASVVEGTPLLGQKSLAVFNGDMHQSSRDANARGILTRMQIDRAPLRRLTLRPLRGYGEGLDDLMQDLETALRAGDQEWAIACAIRMHVFGKCQGLRSAFEKLKADMTDVEKLPVSRVRQFVTSLQTHLATCQLFPQHLLEEYRAPFAELERGVAGIQSLLAPYEGRDTDVSQRTALYRAVKQYLDTIDLEQIASAFLS